MTCSHKTKYEPYFWAYRDDANEFFYDELHDYVFDTQDVEVQGKTNLKVKMLPWCLRQNKEDNPFLSQCVRF